MDTTELPLNLFSDGTRRIKHFREDNVDWFSSLPDSLVVHIFSFLKMEEIIRTSILSRRFRYLYLSVPYLDFDSEELSAKLGDQYCMRTYLDDFMSQRNENRMLRFRLRWLCFEPQSDENRIVAWLCNVLHCGVQELDIEISIGRQGTFILPAMSSFSCGYLEVLKLNLHGGHLVLPSSVFLSLRILSMKSVRIFHDSFGDWISSSCQRLETLNLENVTGIVKLHVTHSFLEHLLISQRSGNLLNRIDVSCESLKTLSIKWFFQLHKTRSLNISAPNLQKFKWMGNIVSHYSLKNIICLQDTMLFLVPPQPGVMDMESFKVVDLLHTIKHARVLELNCWLIEALSRQDCLPPSLYDLQDLVMDISCLKDSIIPALASILKKSPHIKHLTIRGCGRLGLVIPGNVAAGKFGMIFWENEHFTNLRELRTVEMELRGGKNERAFLLHLIRQGKVLEKITIHTRVTHLWLTATDQFLQGVKWASPSLQICFVESQSGQDLLNE
ncbi:putative F-box/LRR-repeat protein At3g58880 [Juglans microcarpa x Juglans regia]|uniref:putative F-box/LRR-repeat protein At3g58880 n=1 Tax=Juglans microcarpa x Juglans regia TaxID=2249226 RepID=UPI001B7EF14A|nr:putative F-box/LRR-repeat protein At3g58880 [Juglans microcarpa x Juglans regia]